MENAVYARLGLIGELPKDGYSYSQGYKSGLGNVKVNIKPLNPTLKRIGNKQREMTDVVKVRLAKAVELGLIKLDASGRYFERRQRVGPYFSANGGTIEASKVTTLSHARVKVQTVNERKFMQAVVPTQREEDVTKVNAVTYTSTGYGALKIRDPKTGQVVKLGHMPNLPHNFR